MGRRTASHRRKGERRHEDEDEDASNRSRLDGMIAVCMEQRESEEKSYRDQNQGPDPSMSCRPLERST